MTPEQDERFNTWLMMMPERIEYAISKLPQEIRGLMDYSRDSLDVIERFCIDYFGSTIHVKECSDLIFVDGLGCYVSEVFRKKFGGKYSVDYSDKKLFNYGQPSLVGGRGMSAMVPTTNVFRAVDRATGVYWSTIFDNVDEDIKMWELNIQKK